MKDSDVLDIEKLDDVGKFAETYTSFNKIINKIQRQYLTLKETYSRQSDELQSVNKTLQSLMQENRAVTEFLNSILNSLRSGVIAVDRNGIVSHMNPSAKQILAISEDTYNGGRLNYGEIFEVVGDCNCSAMKSMENGRGNRECEKKIKTSYGRVLTLSVSISLLFNRSGDVIGAVEMFQDVTKLKSMEEQLSRMKVLASLGEMAASIAHEVRNPLVGVGGFASLLARDLKDDPGKSDMAKKIVEGVDSINKIIQSLLDFARHEKLEKSDVDLNAYLTLILENFTEKNGLDNVNGKIETDLPAGDYMTVELDRHLFKQAVFNIIKNGLEVQSKSQNPVVKLVSRRLLQDEAYERFAGKIEMSGTDTLAEIIITDNGPGIDESNIDKLFSPFHSTKENGIGLGLSIAWKIIKAHGGDIVVASHPGKGSEFSIILPIKST